MLQKRKCRNCKFWGLQNLDGYDSAKNTADRCRKEAPTMNPITGDAHWPLVHMSLVCGKHSYATGTPEGS